MSSKNYENIEATVSCGLQLADKSPVKPIQVRVPEYNSSVVLVPIRQGLIRVLAQQSLLIDNLLYTHDGQMKRHTDEKWYFISAGTVIPTLAPKKKVALTDAISSAINAYMEANPGFLEIFDVLARKQEISQIRSDIDSVTHRITQYQSSITRYQEAIARNQEEIQRVTERLAELQEQLAALLREDGADETPSNTVVLDGEVIYDTN